MTIVACGLAPEAWVLIAARAVQGAGAAIVMPATLTMVTGAYLDPAARSRALGTWSAVGAAGAAAGTLVGGVLTELAGWRWVFLVNVPVTLAIVVAAALVVPCAARGPARARLDLVGALLATCGLTALVYGVLDSAADGWSPAPSSCRSTFSRCSTTRRCGRGWPSCPPPARCSPALSSPDG